MKQHIQRLASEALTAAHVHMLVVSLLDCPSFLVDCEFCGRFLRMKLLHKLLPHINGDQVSSNQHMMIRYCFVIMLWDFSVATCIEGICAFVQN